jgi:tripartite-type tricarboxylate transporter receptor subunit TctC
MHGIKRRDFLGAAATGVLTWAADGAHARLAAQGARSEDYPTRPISLIVPFPAGGAADTVGRLLGSNLTPRIGQPIVIENKPGAGATIGVAAVARAAPDGYTLALAGSNSLAVGVTAFKRLPYDPTKEFSPVALIGHVPLILVVNPSLPVHSVSDLVKVAKEKPGQLTYASGGPGQIHHLCMELLKSSTGMDATHVPYKGNAPALTDVMGGHIPVMFSDTVSALPLIREGKLRALGVSSMTRLASAPEIPTIAEAGVPGFEGVAWWMIVAPVSTPRSIVDKLHAELQSVMALPNIQQKFIEMGLIPVSSPAPKDLQSFIDAEIVRWGKVVDQAGLSGSL